MQTNKEEIDPFKNEYEKSQDLHLLLSEKYMAYRDLADRCMINPHNQDKEDRRVFYLKPDTIFMSEPRLQNQFRNEFIKQISQPPQPEPFTLMADDFHKSLQEEIEDKSSPPVTKDMLAQFYKRKQHRMQHRKYKMLQRWSHFCVTSQLVDKVSIRFSPNYSKVQFELENSVKRWQRLEGDDHFSNTEGKPMRKDNQGQLYEDDVKQINNPQQSTIRQDDIEVYLRTVCFEEKINKNAEKFITRAKWASMTHRFEIFSQSHEYFQKKRNQVMEQQREYVKQIEAKGKKLIEFRKLGDQGYHELKQILSAQSINKIDKKIKNTRDKLLSSCKYTHELPRMVTWNQVELKLELAQLSQEFKVQGDMEVDNGNSFSYNVMVQFPGNFYAFVIKNQFAPYDGVPALINPAHLCKQNLQKVLQRNQKRYGQTAGSNTLLEVIEIKKQSESMNINFINSIEKAIFGEFNNGQLDNFPTVRLQDSHWIPFICYQPEISEDQKYQASILACENNPIDECLANCMEILNLHDVHNVNLVLESMSQIQYDKIKYGQVKTNFLGLDTDKNHHHDNTDDLDEDQFFTEQQRAFLSVFMGSLKSKSEGQNKQDNQYENQEINKNSLYETQQHLLFARYMLLFLKAKSSKTKLLYTLNAFRSIQKRITHELRQMGTRDRVINDVNLVKPTEKGSNKGSGGQAATTANVDSDYSDGDDSDDNRDGSSGMSNLPMSQVGHLSNAQSVTTKAGEQSKEKLNVILDPLVDLNKFRFNNRFSNEMFSTCPIIPKFHSTFGEPVQHQEISKEFENHKLTDPRKNEAQKILGRIDKITKNQEQDLFIVTDDFGVNVMYDSAFSDMLSVESELLRVCSFFINKLEPMLDTDLKNIYPSVDRFSLLEEIIKLENDYQVAKLRLANAYLECYEHCCDILDQQRLVQIIADLMAERPRINLASTHFRESYKVAIDCIEMKVKFQKELIRMQIEGELKANTQVRETIEQTYRLLHENIEHKWQYIGKENTNKEIIKRRVYKYGVKDGDDISIIQDYAKMNPDTFTTGKITPKQFAEMLGLPWLSLQRLMKDHHERDPLVRQSMHEQVGFTKIQEGFPVFMYRDHIKKNNMIKFNDEAVEIEILDFYDSLSVMPKIVAMCSQVFNELERVHAPDNGYLSSTLELITYQFLVSELKVVKGFDTGITNQPKGLRYIEDDSNLGNPERMHFFSKELIASGDDILMAQNPYLIAKLEPSELAKYEFEWSQIYEGLKDGDKANSDDSDDTDYKLNGIDARDRIPDNDEIKEKKLSRSYYYKHYPELFNRKHGITFPSMLELSCNSIEALRLRNVLVRLITEKQVVQEIYQRQMKVMSKDGKYKFKDPLNFESFIAADENWVNFIDEGPATDLDIDLAIKEFDPKLASNLNFTDPEAFKAVICPLGLEELRIAVHYELMHLYCLITGIRTNQVMLDNSMRQLTEIDFFQQGFMVQNPAYDLQSKLVGANLFENNLKKLPVQERSTIQFKITQNLSQYFYNAISNKNRSKDKVEKAFQKVRQAIVNQAQSGEDEKVEITYRQLRSCRIVMGHQFCTDVMSHVYTDLLKLQLLHETDQIRKRAYLLPKESMIHKLSPSTYGEHMYAAYNHEEDPLANQQDAYYNRQSSVATCIQYFAQSDEKIVDYWCVPTLQEIMELESNFAAFKKRNNLEDFYKFELGDITGANDESKSVFATEKGHKELILKYVPKLELITTKELDEAIKENQRLVEFKTAYSYQDSPVMRYLFYFKQFQSLFDLEFFMAKIPSTAFSICGLEKAVATGIPFWEESIDQILHNVTDDDINMSENEEDNNQASGKKNSNQQKLAYSRQKEDFNPEYRNKLAEIVVERMNKEKMQKVQLLQDLEVIKDRFQDIEKIMNKQDMKSDLVQAGLYLHELVTQKFYTILNTCMIIQDDYAQEKKAQKEVQTLQNLIRKISHQDDLKITYANGFHVNSAITSTSKIPIERSVYSVDYDAYFKATQPVIDEAGMVPPEFTLISGIYIVDKINMRTAKKNISYIGAMPTRDYVHLDNSLVNLDRDLRKSMMTTFMANESMSKNFIKARLKVDEASTYTANPNLFNEALSQKRFFLKQAVKSRQLKRILLMIMNKGTIPTELNEYRRLLNVFKEDIQWKVMTKFEEAQHSRSLAEERDRVKRHKMLTENRNSAKMIQNANFNQSAMRPDSQSSSTGETNSVLIKYDQNNSAIEVYQIEIQKYLIQTSLDMLVREQRALARAYEMNEKRIEIFVHPCQQFASTFEQDTDQRNHLNIINKVGPIQKLLTQMKNRCLQIETLTSGVGVVISSKDLNECLEEACRSIIKYGEIEMRTRCEQLALQCLQYENLLYVKDRQLLNLERKLEQAKQEINKIINTKVFSRGNILIYELDRTSRQLRLVKDHLFTMEKHLKDKVRLEFDKELESLRMQLEQMKKKFTDYQIGLNNHVTEGVRNQINSIDATMRKRAEKFKNFDNDIDKEIDEQATALLHSGTSKKIQMEKIEMQKEIDRLIGSEKEAREEIIKLHEYNRKQRIVNGLKAVIAKQKHDFQIDSLKQQLTSNSCLWDQLAESEKREKILKQELQRAQDEIATQDKIIDRMKEEMKHEQIEKHKLIQFKTTKMQRLTQLEQMAKEMEVLQSVNISKILAKINERDKKIQQLEQNETDKLQVVNSLYKLQQKGVERERQRANTETRIKEEAMAKMDTLRAEIKLLQGDENTSNSLWKDRYNKLSSENESLKASLGQLYNNQQQQQSAMSTTVNDYTNVPDDNQMSNTINVSRSLQFNSDLLQDLAQRTPRMNNKVHNNNHHHQQNNSVNLSRKYDKHNKTNQSLDYSRMKDHLLGSKKPHRNQHQYNLSSQMFTGSTVLGLSQKMIMDIKNSQQSKIHQIPTANMSNSKNGTPPTITSNFQLPNLNPSGLQRNMNRNQNQTTLHKNSVFDQLVQQNIDQKQIRTKMMVLPQSTKNLSAAVSDRKFSSKKADYNQVTAINPIKLNFDIAPRNETLRESNVFQSLTVQKQRNDPNTSTVQTLEGGKSSKLSTNKQYQGHRTPINNQTNENSNAHPNCESVSNLTLLESHGENDNMTDVIKQNNALMQMKNNSQQQQHH